MTPKFDTDVQELKYKVLKEVATLALGDALTPENTLGIAETIIRRFASDFHSAKVCRRSASSCCSACWLPPKR